MNTQCSIESELPADGAGRHTSNTLGVSYDRTHAFIRLRGWAAALGPTRFDWTFGAIIGLGMVDAVLARRAGMRFLGWERFCLIGAVPAAVAIYYRVSERSERLAGTGYYISMWLVFSVCACILTYLAARVDLSFRDAQLAHYDSLLSFDWYCWTGFIISHPKIELVLAVAYSSILPQTLGSVIYFSHIRRPDRNDDFLWTTMFAAIITIVISALMPAMGPHFEGQYVAWSATLAEIRNHSVSTFWLAHLQGIIDFPSFHTVAAILLVYSDRPPLRSFRAVLILNMLMLVSIPSEGQHYLVDIISGAIVAAISITAVRLGLGANGTMDDYSMNRFELGDGPKKLERISAVRD